MKIEDVFKMIGAMVIGFAIAFFIWGFNKKKDVVEVETQIPVTVVDIRWRDTCILSRQDSLDIYKTVRRGLVQRKPKIEPVKEEIDTTSKITKYTYQEAGDFFEINYDVLVEGRVLESNLEYRIDTLEIIRLFQVTDSIPVYIEPVIVVQEKEVVKEVPVNKRIIGVSGGAGVHYSPFGAPYVSGGLYYEDAKRRIWNISTGTDKSVEFKIGIPLWKFGR